MINIIKAFDSSAKTYDEWYYHPQGKQIFEAELITINSLIPSKGIGIEIGSGTGIFAENLTKEDRIILCLDPSRGMLSKSKQRGLHSILGDGGFLPFRTNVIDFSYMSTVLEFLENPLEVIQEIKDTCKNTAPLTILFINSESRWGDLYKKIGSQGDPIFQYARLYNLDEVERLLSDSGYFVKAKTGTINSAPENQVVDCRLVEPSSETGVVAVKSIK